MTLQLDGNRLSKEFDTMGHLVEVTELALRDGHQSLFATRMALEDRSPACAHIDQAVTPLTAFLRRSANRTTGRIESLEKRTSTRRLHLLKRRRRRT